MPRNQSEKGPRVLLSKQAKAVSWPTLQPVELRQERPGYYRVRIRHHCRDQWHSYRTTSYDAAVRMYNKIAGDFTFSELGTPSEWEYYRAS